jgi:UDP:flavonoid glycosyltransferase YjiC (YdhE family)
MIVLFPSCAFLSETSRMLAIYRALRARGAAVTMATHGGPMSRLLEDEGVPFDLVPPAMGDDRARDYVRSVAAFESSPPPLFTRDEAIAHARAEATYLRSVGARAVVTGFTLTTLLSSRLAGALLVTDHAGSFVGPVFDRKLAPVATIAPVPIFRVFPRFLRHYVANQGPMRTKAFGAVLDDAAKELGVEGVPSLAALLMGDLTLVTDIPELVGIPREELEGWVPRHPECFRSAHALKYTGPLYAKLDRAIPEHVSRFLDEGDPPVYVALTSTEASYVKRVVSDVVATGRRVLVAGGLHDLAELGGPRVCVGGVLPSHLIFPCVAAGVIMGGQGSVQTALASGVPFVGLPMHPEQDWNVVCAERAGAAIRFDPRRAGDGSLTRALLTLLDGPSAVTARAAAARVRDLYAAVDGADEAARVIVEAVERSAPAEREPRGPRAAAAP